MNNSTFLISYEGQMCSQPVKVHARLILVSGERYQREMIAAGYLGYTT